MNWRREHKPQSVSNTLKKVQDFFAGLEKAGKGKRKKSSVASQQQKKVLPSFPISRYPPENYFSKLLLIRKKGDVL